LSAINEDNKMIGKVELERSVRYVILGTKDIGVIKLLQVILK
jgi:hypothetical protein